MVYVPNPDDATNPIDAVLAETATTEFQALKTKINAMIGLYNNGVGFTNYATTVASLQAQINSLAVAGIQRAGVTINPASAANLVLTSASFIFQEVNHTVATAATLLPAGNSLGTPLGGIPTFVIRNAGAYPEPIKDTSGNLLSWCLPQEAVVIYQTDNTTANGSWRFATGDVARDRGLFWFGASTILFDATNQSFAGSLDSASHQKPATSTCMSSPTLGLFYTNFAANAGFTGFLLAPGAFGIGTFLAQANAYLATNAYSDTCTNGAAEFIVVYGCTTGSAAVHAESISVNGATLACASNKDLSLGAGCAAVSADSLPGVAGQFILAVLRTDLSDLAFFSYHGVAAAIALATSGQVTLTSSPALKSACPIALLSATLAHGLFTTGTAINITRVTIAVTTFTPTVGNAVSVAARAANRGQSMIVALDATHSLAVYTANDTRGINTLATKIYGTVVTDAATPTITEVVLAAGQLAALQTDNNPMILHGISKTSNGKILCLFTDQINYKFAVVSAQTISGVLTAVISDLFDCKPISGQPLCNASGGANEVVIPSTFKGDNNIMVLPIMTANLTFATANAAATAALQSVLTLQPFAVA